MKTVSCHVSKDSDSSGKFAVHHFESKKDGHANNCSPSNVICEYISTFRLMLVNGCDHQIIVGNRRNHVINFDSIFDAQIFVS